MDLKNEFNLIFNDNIRNNYKLKSAYSWPIILISLIAFWPVGFYLFHKRTTIDKNAVPNSYKIAKIAGWILILESVIVALNYYIEGKELSEIYLTFFSVFIGGDILLIWSSMLKKQSIKYKNYINVIENQGIYRLDGIASLMSLDYNTVRFDLQKMIEKGYFPGAYINEATRRFMLQKTIKEMSQQQTSSAELKTKTVSCKNCGANNTVVVGKVCDCEYCGSPI